MRLVYSQLFLLGLFFSVSVRASEAELKKIISVQQAQMAQMKADFEAYKNTQKITLDGLQESVKGLRNADTALKNGNRSSCYEMVLNPGHYSNASDLPPESTIEGNGQVGPLTKLMCKSGYFLSGIRIWNLNKTMDRAYCCSL